MFYLRFEISFLRSYISCSSSSKLEDRTIPVSTIVPATRINQWSFQRGAACIVPEDTRSYQIRTRIFLFPSNRPINSWILYSCSYSIVLVGLNVLLRSTVSVLRTEPVVSIREVIRTYIDRDTRIVRQVRYTLERCVKRVSEVSTGERCLCTRPETRRATLVPSGRRGVASPVSLSLTPFFSRADSPSRLLSTLYDSISRSVREKWYFIVNLDLSETKLIDFILSVDCFVLLHRYAINRHSS